MMGSHQARVGPLGAALAAVILLGATQMPQFDQRRAAPVDGAPAACEAELQPDTLTIRERPASILARLPRDLGEPHGVEIPARSGLEVSDVRPDPDGRSWIVSVYLGNANPGKWTLRLRGSDGECEASLTTRMPGDPGSGLWIDRDSKSA
jgi:hypothetical protein